MAILTTPLIGVSSITTPKGSSNFISVGSSSSKSNIAGDTINLSNGNSTFLGGSSDNVFNAGGGDDRLIGGSGNDTLSGGIGNDTLTGGSGNDTLTGGTGKDTLTGGTGKDTLTGGIGIDLLTGGSGNDVFDFNSVLDSRTSVLRDVITDFVGNGSLPGDRIDLSTIDANSTKGGNQVFTFIGAGAFSAPGQIRYSGGILQGSTDGDISSEFEIRLVGAPRLVASDIIL